MKEKNITLQVNEVEMTWDEDGRRRIQVCAGCKVPTHGLMKSLQNGVETKSVMCSACAIRQTIGVALAPLKGLKR